MSEVPKMPWRMKDVYAQIMSHPEYKTKLSEGTRFAFVHGVVGGGSWRTAENNAWSRQIWVHLYLYGPAP